VVLFLAQGWMEDRVHETAEGIRLARRAVEYGRDDAVALARSSHAVLHLAGEIDTGIALLDRALVLNPNFASAWSLMPGCGTAISMVRWRALHKRCA
jgi:pimeloyl-ACP methyl ester carboxylesterase